MNFNATRDTKFQRAILDRVRAGDSFMDMLDMVCRVVSSYIMSENGFDLGGFNLEHIKTKYTPFELACFEALEKFDGEPTHFRYAFMDTWVIVCCFNKAGI